MTQKSKDKKPLLERLQKYETLIAGSVLFVGLALLIGFVTAFIIKTKAELDTFVIKTSSTQWANASYSGMYFPENKLSFSQDPYGDKIVNKCVIFAGTYLTADSSGKTVLVDDENKKVEQIVFISDTGRRITATSTKDGVTFLEDEIPVDEFFLDGYMFLIKDGKVTINNYDLATYGDLEKIQTTTTTTTTTTTVVTTTPEVTTTTPETSSPVVSGDKITSTTPQSVTTAPPKTTTVTTTKKPTPTTTTKKTTVTTTTTKKKTTTTKITTTSPTATNYKSDDEFVKEVLKLVNAERKKAGLKEVKGMITLDKAATIRAQEITGADENFSHTRPNGNKWYTILAEVGISPMVAGENLAAGQTSPEMVVSDWMASEDHKQNILDPEYDYVGLGYVKYNGYYYWAQIFAAF